MRILYCNIGNNTIHRKDPQNGQFSLFSYTTHKTREQNIKLAIPLLLIVFLCSSIACNSGNKTEKGDNNISNIEESDSDKQIGFGPIKELILPDSIDQEMVAQGKMKYEELCTVCHNMTEKFIGPPQKGILTRRSPEWVMNMMLNPEGMIREDPIAKKLLAEYGNIPMTDQQLSENEARQILEYFRTIN